MVRAHVKQSDEEKKETRKKKTPVKSKKSSEAGVWPCKINGCNKQFAREADLKRHQRTTKSHSMPGFACPQCDATFTRTDALRRHQKSRHNGVIIEPVETQKNQEDGDNNEAGSSASKPGSRSSSPTAKGKGKGKAKKNAETPTALANPGTAGPASGPSSYYRQHTMQNVFFSPQGMMMEAQQYTQNGLAIPTSATRLHQASWPPPPPWAAEGPQPQMGTISYHPGQQPGFYQPSPYYRQNGPMNGTPVMQQQFVSQPQDMQSNMSPHQNAAPTQDNHASRTGTPPMQTNSNQQGADAEMKDGSNTQGTTESQSVPAAPVIDPSLDMSSTTTATQQGSVQGGGNAQGGQGSPSKPVSLEITQAAMEAVLHSAQRESSRTSGTPDTGGSPANGHINAQASIAGGSQQQVGGGVQGGTGAVSKPNSGGDAGQLHIPTTTTTAKSPFAHQSPIQQLQPLLQPGARPEPMEQMLTEDGEPMLNPAELLTQESLASPPPSR